MKSNFSPERLICLFTSVLSLNFFSQAQGINKLKVTVDGFTTNSEYRYWSGNPYLRLDDTAARMGWYPQIDGYHNIVDLARCLRVDYTQNKMYRVDFHPLIGKNVISGAEEIGKLSPAAKLVDSDIWIPVIPIAKTMGYKVIYSSTKNSLELTSPKNTQDGTLEFSCQRSIKFPRLP